MTFRLSLDSSIFISQLTGDVHAEAVLTALLVLETMGAELTLPLLCYAELWTGVELLPEADRPAAAETLERMLRASVVLLVADNVAIAGFLAVFAEFERDVIRERIKAGIIDARKRGKTHGRPRATANNAAQIRTLAQQGLSQAAIARHLGLWRTSVRRVLAQQEGT